MARRRTTRPRPLGDLVARALPQLDDPRGAIAAGAIAVDGIVATNPASLVRADATISLHGDAPLRGETKLRAALDAFGLRVAGRVALDLGAAAGGFTRALLAAGAARVYAVDAGHGQLVGSLRQDLRVVNLERTNLGALNRALVPDVVGVVSADLSYVALAAAIPQLEGRVALADDADLVALVKPQFELGLARAPTDANAVADAVSAAAEGVARAGWIVVDAVESPVRGRRGSAEALIHASRQQQV